MTPGERAGGLVFVLSGPSGAGKTALTKRLRSHEAGMHYCVTATTRAPRPTERPGVDYIFCSRDEFLDLERTGGLLEWAQVPPETGQFYGTPREQVEQALDRGQDVFLQVDVQGARSLRALIPNAILIFLKPPAVETLQHRLEGRATETRADVERRLTNARVELEHEPEFDYAVVNADGRLEEAVARVRAIIVAERSRVVPRYAVFQLSGPGSERRA
jgi:guanylate kinase